MKTILTAALMFASLAVSAQTQDELKYKTISQGEIFSELTISGAFTRVEVYQVNRASEAKVEIAAKDTKRIDEIDYRLTGNELELSNRDNSKDIDMNTEKFYARIYTTEITDISAAAVTRIDIKDKFDYQELSLEIAAVSTINFEQDVEVDGDFSLEVTAASAFEMNYNIEVGGKMDVECSAAASISFDGDVTVDQDMNLDVSAAAKIYFDRVLISQGSLDVSSSALAKATIDHLTLTRGGIDLSSSALATIKIDAGEMENKNARVSIDEDMLSSIDVKGLKR